jgi:hypothetical protein
LERTIGAAFIPTAVHRTGRGFKTERYVHASRLRSFRWRCDVQSANAEYSLPYAGSDDAPARTAWPRSMRVSTVVLPFVAVVGLHTATNRRQMVGMSNRHITSNGLQPSLAGRMPYVGNRQIRGTWAEGLLGIMDRVIEKIPFMDLLHALGTFVRIVETGSFSAVARKAPQLPAAA